MSNILSLDKLSEGQCGKVAGIDCPDAALRNKLLSLGLVQGQAVEVCHFAPLGDPMTIKCTGAWLCLRLCEARCIHVMPS